MCCNRFFGEIKLCVVACEYTFAFAVGIEVTCGFEKPELDVIFQTSLISTPLSFLVHPSAQGFSHFAMGSLKRN